MNGVIRRLHRIIKKNTIKGAGEAIKVKAFQQIIPNEVKVTFGGPYGWAVHHCVVVLGRWATKGNHWINYVFESGAEGRHEVDKALEGLYNEPRDRDRYRIAGWGFKDKKGPNGLIQLQAADFIAYEAFKQTDNQVINGVKRPYRKSARDLIRQKTDHLHVYRDKEMMDWFVHALKNPEFVKWLAETKQRLAG